MFTKNVPLFETLGITPLLTVLWCAAACSTDRSSRSVTPFRWVSSAFCTAWCFVVWGTAKHRRCRHRPTRQQQPAWRRPTGSWNAPQGTATQLQQQAPGVATRHQSVAPQDSSSSSSFSLCPGYLHRYVVTRPLKIVPYAWNDFCFVGKVTTFNDFIDWLFPFPNKLCNNCTLKVCEDFFTEEHSQTWFNSVKNMIWMHSLTHSLLRLTSEGRSDLHNERSCADDHRESIVRPWSSSSGCIQVFLGRPGGRFQSGQVICPARGWRALEDVVIWMQLAVLLFALHALMCYSNGLFAKAYVILSL